MSRMLHYFPQCFQWLQMAAGNSTQHERDMEQLSGSCVCHLLDERGSGRRAQQCLEMARTFGDQAARVTLAHMAEVWLKVADRDQDAKKVRPAMQQQH